MYGIDWIARTLVIFSSERVIGVRTGAVSRGSVWGVVWGVFRKIERKRADSASFVVSLVCGRYRECSAFWEFLKMGLGHPELVSTITWALAEFLQLGS